LGSKGYKKIDLNTGHAVDKDLDRYVYDIRGTKKIDDNENN